MHSFWHIGLASMLVLTTASCSDSVVQPGGGGHGGTSMGHGGSTTVSTSSETVSTSSDDGSCDGLPPDPECGCTGWEIEDLCRCDCGGTMVDTWGLNTNGCQQVFTEQACPNGFGGAGGAPAMVSCTLLDSHKVCGP